MSTNDVVIYCNGDSFVNGYELADDLLSDYPGCYDFDVDGKTAQIYNDWYQLTFDYTHKLGKERANKSKFIFNKQRDLAFPNLIQQKTGFHVINAALKQLGNSQSCIARNTITDLYNLKQQNKKIIAIIGTTSLNRIDIPNHTNNGWNNVMLSNPKTVTSDHYDEKLQGLLEFYFHYYTDYHLYIEWLKNILLIKNYCFANDIPLLWVTGIYPLTYNELPNEPDLEAFYHSTKIEYDVNMKDLARTVNTKTMTPGYHYSPDIHDKTADILINKMSKYL